MSDAMSDYWKEKRAYEKQNRIKIQLLRLLYKLNVRTRETDIRIALEELR